MMITAAETIAEIERSLASGGTPMTHNREALVALGFSKLDTEAARVNLVSEWVRAGTRDRVYLLSS